MSTIQTESPATYNAGISRQEVKASLIISEDRVIKRALDILSRRLYKADLLTATSPEATRQYLILKTATLEHEVFGCLFLDNQHHLINDSIMFRGTIDGASVYTREVVKEALKHNAAAVIFYHNHPSGLAEPSQADKNITKRLKDALGLIDMRVLDHIIVGGVSCFSFTEKGMI